MPKKGYKQSKEHKEKLSKARKGRRAWHKGKRWTKEIREKMSSSHKGKKLLEETKLKISKKLMGRKATLETRKKMSIARRGSGSALWKGGLTEKNKLLRMSLKYKLWREAIFKRDDWTCQKCNKRGVKLAPHHKKSFAEYPELRFDINNGITLCHECHKKTDNYGINRKIKVNCIKD